MKIFKQVPRILYGEGASARLTELFQPSESSTFFVIFVIDDIFKNSSDLKQLPIKNTDKVYWFNASAKEPSTKQVNELRDTVLKECTTLPDVIVGIGGGSTMDVAKALSVMLKNEGIAEQYQGWDLVKKAGIFKIGIPTIAGSGSEASRTAVLMGVDKKFGINSDFSMFDAIILDPLLLKGVPKLQRFYSAMDCYIHCVESLQGTMINELAKGYASKALELCRNYYLNSNESQHLNDGQMLVASYMGGCSVVNSEVGIAHALSYGLSLELGYRHGLANCVVFDVLEEYYGKYVLEFRKMLNAHQITFPKGGPKSLSDTAMERMVQMTLRMEKPLTNALGSEWKKIMTPQKIRELYNKM